MTKTRQWTVFTAVAVVVVLLAGWFLLVKPQQSHASSVRDQAASQSQANQVLQTQITTLQSEEKNEAQEQQVLQKFATQVPDNAAEPTLIRQLSAAASGANIDLVSMTPGTASVLTTTGPTPGSTSLTSPSTAAGQVVALPVAIEVVGTYPNVESYFQLIENLPRALLVGSWSLCLPPGSFGGTNAAGSNTGDCQLPPPTGHHWSSQVLDGKLNLTVFYAPPTSSTSTSASALTGGATTTPTTAATPAPSTSAAATPAPSATTSAPAE